MLNTNASNQQYVAVGYAAQNEPQDPSALGGVLARLTMVLGRSSELKGRMQGALDRAYGHHQAEAEKATPRPVASGTVGSINEKIDMLEETLSAIEGALGRLDTLV